MGKEDLGWEGNRAAQLRVRQGRTDVDVLMGGCTTGPTSPVRAVSVVF